MGIFEMCKSIIHIYQMLEESRNLFIDEINILLEIMLFDFNYGNIHNISLFCMQKFLSIGVIKWLWWY